MRRPSPRQYREAEDLWAGPGVPALTKGMATGLLWGSVVGGRVGALLLAPLALIDFADLAWGWRLLLVMSVGALAGGTAGAVFLGSRLPVMRGETADSERPPPRTRR